MDVQGSTALSMFAELMLVGFISLTLTILQDSIEKICIRSSLYTKWSPCKMPVAEHDVAEGSNKFSKWPRPSDFTFATEQSHGRRRLLASAPSGSVCPEGHESFLSAQGLHQLHIFIFVLAAAHVVYSCITMALALAKVHSWHKWEAAAHEETSPDGMAELVVNNISYTRQSTFMRYHTSKPWSRSRFIVWVVCFFQQFHIPRADYLTLRFSFITCLAMGIRHLFLALQRSWGKLVFLVIVRPCSGHFGHRHEATAHCCDSGNGVYRRPALSSPFHGCTAEASRPIILVQPSQTPPPCHSPDSVPERF
ncbi:hypothetical protein M758_1G082700 [Ceratodon purpureus]|nr:hypothetical protein M758_1G082700 [Ceratodon purpureus]